jgi:hypothetical protein
MEQPVWIIFGIISVLLALGIIMTVYSQYSLSIRSDVVSDSIQKIQAQCSFACSSTVGTKQPILVDFPYNSTIYATKELVCASYQETIDCARCPCQMSMKSLSLNTTLAQKIGVISYSCIMEKKQTGVFVSCVS